MSKSLNYLITGAARGIGRGLSRSLLSQGHRVFLLDSNREELENTQTLLTGLHSTSPSSSSTKPFYCSLTDLSNRTELEKAVSEAHDFFSGRLDVLINNAFATPHVWNDGKTMEDPEADILEQWDTKLAVGLTAPFILARLCVPMLTSASARDTSRKPGCIINISSTRAYQAEPNHEAYSAVKAGLLGLTQSLAISLGRRHNIRVNAITPGWIWVMEENAAADKEGIKWEDGLSREDHEWHPAGRVGKVDDIVKAVEFLVESEFVTGQEIVVDGGVTKKMVYPE